MLFLEEGYQRGSSVLAEVADDATVPNVLADAFLLLLFVAMTALVLVGLHARWAAGAMVLVGVVDNFQSNFFLFDLAHPLAHLGELQKMLLTHQYRFFQAARPSAPCCCSSSTGPATSPSTPRAAAAAATRPRRAAAAAAPCRSPRRSS